MRVFNIGFNVLNGGAEEPICDETQFDIEDTGDFSGMMTGALLLVSLDVCLRASYSQLTAFPSVGQSPT